MSRAQKIQVRYRDASTGHYVSAEYAREHPDTTVKETLITHVPKVTPPKPTSTSEKPERD